MFIVKDMAEEQKRGFYKYTPYFLSGKYGEFIPVYAISDAVMECAKVGIKAGNFLIEDIEMTEKSLRKSGLIEVLSKLSKKTN